MKKIASLLFILFSTLHFQGVYSQISPDNNESSISKFSVFREPSYILFGSGIGNLEPLIFEGNIATHFMISLNHDQKWGVELSPRIIIRMYNKESLPIRTPSFIPKATFFYHLVDSINKKKDLFMYFSMLHHSNGQDGSFYNADSITINTQSGNFSTNWIEAGVYISRPSHMAFTSNDYKIYAAYNFMQEVGLNDSYGRLRFFFDFQSKLNLSKLFGIKRRTYNNGNNTLRQSLHFGWIADHLTDTKTFDSKRFIFRYRLAIKPSFLNDVTLFTQYDYGQDYYNIYYGRKLNVIRFGIASSANIFN